MAEQVVPFKRGRRSKVVYCMIDVVKTARVLDVERQAHLAAAEEHLAAATAIEQDIASLHSIHQRLNMIRVAKEEGRLK